MKTVYGLLFLVIVCLASGCGRPTRTQTHTDEMSPKASQARTQSQNQTPAHAPTAERIQKAAENIIENDPQYQTTSRPLSAEQIRKAAAIIDENALKNHRPITAEQIQRMAKIIVEYAPKSQTPSRPLSAEQIQKIAEIILEHTPEHTHVRVGGGSFGWVLLSPDVKSNLPEVQDAVLARLRQKYTVYYDEKDVPDELKPHNGRGGSKAFRNGFRFSYRVEFIGEGSIKVHISDWEASLSASSQWKKFKWLPSEHNWKVTDKGGMAVS